MKFSAGLVTAVILLTVCPGASAKATVHHDASQRPLPAKAAQEGALASWLEEVGINWAKQYAKRVAKAQGQRALAAAGTWLISGGTECDFPFPKMFCSPRAQPSPARAIWGLGVARSWFGQRPGVWNRPSSPRTHDAFGLQAGASYWLTCWTLGDRTTGPGGTSNLWYRLTQGGYAAAVWLFTGTSNVIPGVQRCG